MLRPSRGAAYNDRVTIASDAPGVAEVEARAGPKPRVTLVRGPIVSTTRSVNNEATPCIGLAYVAAYARKYGHDVTIVDSIGEGLNSYWPVPEFPGFIGQGLTIGEVVERVPVDTDVVGFSTMFSGEWPVQRRLIAALRAKLPRALFVAGGEHVTALPEWSLRDCPALDVVVRGEGEHAFYEILECVARSADLGRVGGLAYRGPDGAIVVNGPMPRIKAVDGIPWPHWPDGYLENFWAAGKSYGVATARDMPLLVSRGCPFQFPRNIGPAGK